MQTKEISARSLYYPPGGILIWIVIFLELFTFGIALIAMISYSKDEPEVFHKSRKLLNATFGAINTLFLISSGYFMAKSVENFKIKNIDKTSLYLKLTMLGGVFFLILKSIEYYGKIETGLTIGYNTFFSFYWMLTLFHVIHVIVGLVILMFFFTGIKNKKAPTQLNDFEAGAAFWHMCDLIWLLLFPVIYLIF